MYRILFKFVDSEKVYTTQGMSSDDAMAFMLGAYHADLVIESIEKHSRGSLVDWEIDVLKAESSSDEACWNAVTF